MARIKKEWESDTRTFEVKITGSGTRQELKQALSSVIQELITDEFEGGEFENPTLMTEIKPF